MDIEAVREYCLSLPLATEDMAFGDDCLLLRVCGRIFACFFLERDNTLVLKCNPDYAVDLKDEYSQIESAWHWNKKYWIQFRLDANIGSRFVQSLIRHSYSEVVKKLPKKVKLAHPEIVDVI
jgi:predicted DNA-binding protein (MmcQ/YjbR family)